jgi:hypothetical protein
MHDLLGYGLGMELLALGERTNQRQSVMGWYAGKRAGYRQPRDAWLRGD